MAPGAGTRPQTSAFPSTTSATFHAAMQDVWLAVTTGNARLALPAFFPRAAYQRLKAIYDPGEDWDDRLWYDFTLDVAAAHRVVGHGARLDRVIVAGYDAAWVYPGVCANSLGYWHVHGARVVYRQHGQERSFGIASLISWRGVWYVVHFGAVLRSVVTGIVDDPETGPGLPGPAGPVRRSGPPVPGPIWHAGRWRANAACWRLAGSSRRVASSAPAGSGWPGT